ncbi:MAG: hypothetical protein J0L53_01945 [Spirochaetes bacterium]|nr:hypothetical protein [Spirochaetota bacterium]
MIERKDFILRLVAEFGAFLRRVFEKKQDDRHGAEVLVDGALEQITGLKLSLFRMLDFQSGLRMIERSRTLSADECIVLAQLLVEKADLAQETDLSMARGYLGLARQRGPVADAELRQLVTGLEAKLG